MSENTFPLDWDSRTYVMGVINLTPDSFSGDGLVNRQDWLPVVLEQARRFVNAGADILDLGGESTRPGAQLVSEEEEIERLQPALKLIV